MALTTQSISSDPHHVDRTPDVEVRFDKEGKGYLFRKDKIVKKEESKPLEEIKKESTTELKKAKRKFKK